MAFILWSTNKILLWISLSIIAIVVVWAYIQRVILIFKPSGIYQLYTRIIIKGGEALRANPLAFPIPNQASANIPIENIPVECMNDAQLQKWTSTVQQLVLVNRLLLFLSKKFKIYQDSKSNVITHIFSILLMILFTTFSFSLINFGLYKINANYFSFPSFPTFFTFVYYSFNNLLFNSIREIIPALPVSQIVSMFESFLALFLIAIFVTLLLTFKNQKEIDELSALIASLTSEGEKIESLIKDKYQLNTIDEALEALSKAKAALIDFLINITKSIS